MWMHPPSEEFFLLIVTKCVRNLNPLAERLKRQCKLPPGAAQSNISEIRGYFPKILTYLAAYLEVFSED